MIYDKPCREKYIDETVGIWIILGERSNGTVDITDGTRDIAYGISRETAEKLCDLQEKFRESIYDLVGLK